MDLTGKYIFGVYKPRKNRQDDLDARHSDLEGLAVYEGNNIKPINSKERIKTFPPNGLAFIPTNNPALKDGDFIKCKIKESISDDQVGRHRYIIDFETITKPINCTPVIDYDGLVLEFTHINLSTILNIARNHKLSDDTDFYVIDQQGVYGVFVYKDNSISPKIAKDVRHWKTNTIENCILEYKNRKYLPPDSVPKNSEPIDCMTNNQLVEWFREQIQLLNKDYVKHLDDKTRWRRELPKLFENQNGDERSLSEARFDRVKEMVDSIELSIEEIINFTTRSDGFRKIYETKIDQYRETLFKDHAGEIQEQINHKNQELNELTKQLLRAKEEYQDIQVKLDKLKPQEQLLKDSLLPKITEQLKTFRDVLNPAHYYTLEVYSETYPAAEIQLVDYKEIKEHLEETFSYFGIKRDLVDTILREMFVRKALFIPDGKCAKAVATGLGNSVLFVVSVSHRWESFSHFLSEGFSQAFNAATDDSNKRVILLIQDINMAPPEIWGRPLLNVVAGIQDEFQSLGRLPDNFWIFATLQPTQEPAIGLPLNRSSFASWGAIPMDWATVESIGSVRRASVSVGTWKRLQESYKQEAKREASNLDEYFEF